MNKLRLVELSDFFNLNSPRALSQHHSIIMQLFMLSVNTYAILIFRTHLTERKSIVKITHILLAVVNLGFAIFGICIMFRANQLRSKPNFYSLHSWLGSITTFLYFVQILASFSIFLNPKSSQQLRKCLMPTHRTVGTLLLVFACLSSVTGISEMVIFHGVEAYQNFTAVTFVANFAALLTIVSTGVTIYLLASQRFSRPSKERDELEQTLISPN